MSKALKALAKELDKLDGFPAESAGIMGARRSLAGRVIDAHKAFLAAIEEEQEYRKTKHFFKRKPAHYASLQEASNLVLAAHKGWCLRVIDSGDVILKDRAGSSQDEDVLSALLRRAREDLLNNRYKFVGPKKESLFQLAMKAVRRKLRDAAYGVKKLQRSVWSEEQWGGSTNFDNFKSLGNSEFKTLASEMPAGDPVIANSAQLVKPEEAGVNGRPVEPPRRISEEELAEIAKEVGEELAALYKGLPTNTAKKEGESLEENPTKVVVPEMVGVVNSKAVYPEDPDIRLHKVC